MHHDYNYYWVLGTNNHTHSLLDGTMRSSRYKTTFPLETSAILVWKHLQRQCAK